MIRVSNPEADAFASITWRLRQYRSMVANYYACKELYDFMFPSGTQVLTDMPHCQQDTFEPERMAEKRLSQWSRMEVSLNEMRLAYEELERLVSLTTGNYNTVLLRRYMLNESYEIIAEKMHCHRNTIKRWHDRAIETIIKNMVLNSAL